MDADVPATELANFCPNCGRPYAQEDRFCPSCGRSRKVPATIARESGTHLASAPPGGVSSPPLRSDAAATPISVLPLGVRPVLTAAVVTYATTVVLSVALAAILIFAAASALSLLLGGSDAGSSLASGQSPGQPSLSDVGTVLKGLVTFVSYMFLAGHFGPLEATALGGATYSVIGVGSLTIAGLAFLVSFTMARRIERRVATDSAGPAFVRGAVLAIPYGMGALALYVPSVVTLGPQQLGISLHASLLGVFLAAGVAGLGGGLGAASIRIVHGVVASSLVRGAARATAAIALGALLTAVMAVAWNVVGAVVQPSASTSTTLPSPSAAAQVLGWSLAALMPFYFFNAIAFVWSATLDGWLFSTSPLHLLIYLGPIAGALLGAVKLRGNRDRVEQASYVGSFAAFTGVIAFLTTPRVVNGPALLPNPWTGVLVALVFAAAAALAAPYLLAVAPVRAFASRAPLTWVMKPLLGLWPAEVIDRTPHEAPSVAVTVPRLRPPRAGAEPIIVPHLRPRRMYALLAGVLVILIASSLVAHSQLSARFSPEGAALSYLGAQSRGDTDAMWALMTFEAGTPSTSSQLLTKDALKAMLMNTGNRDVTNVSVADSSHQDDANYTITAHLTKAGQPTTVQLRVRKDVSRSNWLIYPYWRVVVAPSLIQITTYPHAGQVTIDGIDSGVSDGAGRVAVIPGVHRLVLAPTDIFLSETEQVDATSDTSLAFETQLSEPAASAAPKAVDAAFIQCAVSQQLRPAGCPNSTSSRGDHQSHIHWTLVGDPATNMLLRSRDTIDSVLASGAWRMHVSFDYWSNFGFARIKHWDEDISGDFSDTLLWNGSRFDIASHSATISAATNGTSSVPAASIIAVFVGPSLSGEYFWHVVGQYFTPDQHVVAYLYDPYDAPKWISSNAPGLSVRRDGTFLGDFELVGPHGKALIKACDSANICAGALVTSP